MRWLVETSLKFRLLIVALGAAMLLLAVLQLPSMALDVLPEFNPPSVEVQTEALGLSAEEVQQMITVPLEQDLLNGVAWLESIRSESVPGLSSIVMTFQPGTDLFRARQMVGERLTQAFALPHVSKPPTMLQPTSTTSRVMMIGLTPKDISLIDLSVVARWTVAPRLMGVPGVANVSIWGQRDRQLQVLVDPNRLRDNHVTLLQILETTGNAMVVSSLSFVEASTPGTGGFIETNNQRLGIRHIFPISSPQGLAQVPVEGATGLRLGDVANVVEDHQPLIGNAIGSEGDGLLLVVEKLPGANTLDVTRGVDKALAAMRPGLPGVSIDASLYRPASFIEAALANVAWALLLGALLAAVAVGLLFFEWRSALIALLAVPLAIGAALVVLYLRGTSLNTMVLAGLAVALGMVIHEAVLSVDNILRALVRNRAEGGTRPVAAVIVDACLQSKAASVYGALILVLAVVPVFFIGGVAGSFYLPLVATYCLAVLTALIVALTVTPALSLLLLTKAPVDRRQSPVLQWVQRSYQRGLRQVVHAPRLAFAGLAALLLVGAGALPFLQTAFVPSFKEPNLLIRLEGSPGTARAEMDRIVGRASQEIRSIAGVNSVGAHIGRAVLSDRRIAVNSSEIWVSVDPSAGYDQTVAAIQATVDNYPGLNRSVETYLKERTRTLGASTDNAVTVRVFGENMPKLRTEAEKVQAAIANVQGVSKAEVLLPVEEPTLEIRVDLEAAQKAGLKPGDIRRSAATLLSGIQAGSLFDAQKVFDVVVWGTPETRTNIHAIRELLLDSPDGNVARLRDVASVNIVPATTAIRHEGVRTYLDVRASVNGRPLSAVSTEVNNRIHSLNFPLEYHAEILGDNAAREATQNRLLGLVIAALLGMFLLVQAAVGSWRLAAVACVAVPAALTGGVLAALATGGVLSLGSALGLLLVFGLAARGVVLLITRYHQLEREDGDRFGSALVLQGASEHLSLAFTSACAIGLVLLPMVIFGDSPGLEILRPMAITVLGGLITSTILTLFIVPIIYLRFGATAQHVTADSTVGGFRYAGAASAAD